MDPAATLRVARLSARVSAGGPAAQFHSGESGDSEQKKGKKENQERGVHGQNGRGQNSRERKHGQEKRVTVARCAVKADQGNEDQEMHRPQEYGEERWIR